MRSLTLCVNQFGGKLRQFLLKLRDLRRNLADSILPACDLARLELLSLGGEPVLLLLQLGFHFVKGRQNTVLGQSGLRLSLKHSGLELHVRRHHAVGNRLERLQKLINRLGDIRAFEIGLGHDPLVNLIAVGHHASIDRALHVS